MSCRFTPIPVTLADGALRVGDRAVLSTVPAGVSAVCDPFGHGVVVRVEAEAATHHLRQELGRLAGVRRFTCCYRYDPWWVAPRCGRKGREIPVETQYLLAELPGGACVVLLPLLDGPFRCAIEGTAKDALALVADSNDPGVVTQAVNGLFVAAGDNPYELMHAAAQSLVAFMGRGRLREDKPLPDFINDFGWCTWDAFYGEVNHDKVRAGLQSFADAGVPPRMMILDDGWLSHRTAPTGENRLTAFAADPRKFPQGLAATVTMAKAEFGLRRFLVWHTLQGYWGGVDAAAFPEYTVVNNVREFSPGVVHNCAQANAAFGRGAGLVHPRDVHRFFQDFHRHLRSQGVDGVKVDNQSTLEGVARGLGGRAAVMQAYHEAVEGAAQTHFLGRLINCMSHATDVIYQTLNSTLTRSYTDFWPRDPKSHGLHQYANAQNSLWLSEFIHPDWDMFQSDHPMAPLHAAARAVSGGPVYVSDKPGVHNVELLRKLVLSDGTILRARGCGRPTRDCLFHDTTKEDVLLKVFNRNGFGGVIGVFQTQYHEA